MNQEESHLRQRNVRRTGDTPDDEGTTAARDPGGVGAGGVASDEEGGVWEDQLALARKALADRVQKQMEDDGVRFEEGVEDTVDRESAHLEVDGDRRGSTSSAGDEQEVSFMLTGRTHVDQLSRHDGEEAVEELQGDQSEGRSPSQDGVHEEGQAPDAQVPAGDDNPGNAQAPREEDKMCRICFDGHDEELGRLFSPCQCRGTSRYVHVVCLDRWRMASAGNNSFYKCHQCGYEYKLRRAKIASIAQHRVTLLLTTSIVFMFLIYLAGFAANYLLSIVEKRAAALNGGLLDEFFVSDYVIVGEGMREAVDFFGKTVDKTGWKALTAEPTQEDDDDDSGDDGSGTLYRKYFVSERKRREEKAKLAEQRRRSRKAPFGRRVAEHFIKGFSLVGISAFFQTFIATALFGPFGLRGTLFRAVRPNRRNNENQGTSMSQIVIVLFVIVGAAKAITHVYAGVKWGTKKALTRVEALVLDV
ncbi:hypothetical protein T439DRAFT_329477 [Meredithblackwellia eburnea MCA 4105]